MNHGQLNKRVTYTNTGTHVSDGYGGSTVTEGADVETWASVKQLSMTELIRYGLPEGQSVFRFVFHEPQGKNIKRGTELTYDNNTFKVNSVVEDGRMTIIIATRND